MLHLGLLIAGALFAVGPSERAVGAVTVLGGGSARDCSEAAQRGESDVRFEQACTDALGLQVLTALDRAGTYVNRGIIKLRRADYDAAIADFGRAIEVKPDLSVAFVNRGAAMIGARRYKDSIADINHALSLGVEEPHKAFYNRGLAYEWSDDAVSAQLDFQKALELSPDWSLPRRELARYGIYPAAEPRR